MARDDRDDKDSEDFEHISAMASRLKLKGRERDRYIHQHMTGLGYRMVPSYVRDDDDDDSGSRFSFRSRDGGRGRGRVRDDDDDGYPF